MKKQWEDPTISKLGVDATSDCDKLTTSTDDTYTDPTGKTWYRFTS